MTHAKMPNGNRKCVQFVSTNNDAPEGARGTAVMTTTYKEPQIGIEPMTASVARTPLSQDSPANWKDSAGISAQQAAKLPQKQPVSVSKVCLAFSRLATFGRTARSRFGRYRRHVGVVQLIARVLSGGGTQEWTEVAS